MSAPYTAFSAYKDVTGVVGLSATTLCIPPGEMEKHWGIPWSFTTQAGMENISYVDPSGVSLDPLRGSGGPWPEIHLYNERGEHMAQEKRPIGYLQEGTTDSRLVFPDYYGKPYHDVAWVVLKQNHRDPICIVDFTISHMSPAGQQRGPDSFSSVTAQTCGMPWYWSNIYRKGDGSHDKQVPCFWLGKSGVNVLQAHMPTHSRANPNLGENVTHEVLWNYYCNRPTVLSWHEKVAGGINSVLEKSWYKTGGRDYRKDFLQLHDDNYTDTRKPGEVYKKPRYGGKPGDKKKPSAEGSTSASLVSSEEGLTVEYKAVEKSAEILCNSKSAAGPDYVNVPEGLFCRMADRMLFPLCDFSDAKGLHDGCFDVESQELVLEGRQLLKRSQYAFVRHRGHERV